MLGAEEKRWVFVFVVFWYQLHKNQFVISVKLLKFQMCLIKICKNQLEICDFSIWMVKKQNGIILGIYDHKCN